MSSIKKVTCLKLTSLMDRLSGNSDFDVKNRICYFSTLHFISLCALCYRLWFNNKHRGNPCCLFHNLCRLLESFAKKINENFNAYSILIDMSLYGAHHLTLTLTSGLVYKEADTLLCL